MGDCYIPETNPEDENCSQPPSLETKALNENASELDKEKDESNFKQSKNNYENEVTSNTSKNENDDILSSSRPPLSPPEQLQKVLTIATLRDCDIYEEYQQLTIATFTNWRLTYRVVHEFLGGFFGPN